MKKSTIIKIEKYLNGALNHQEVRLFQEQIVRTPALKDAITNYKIANEAIELMIADKTRALL